MLAIHDFILNSSFGKKLQKRELKEFHDRKSKQRYSRGILRTLTTSDEKCL